MLHSPSGFPFWISRVTIGCGLFRFDTLPYYLLKVRLLQPLTGARSWNWTPECLSQIPRHTRRSAHPYSGISWTYPKISELPKWTVLPHSSFLCTKRIVIGNPLKLSPDFPPPHTGHAAFTAPGVPSSWLTTLHRGSTLHTLTVYVVLTNFTFFYISVSSLLLFRPYPAVSGRCLPCGNIFCTARSDSALYLLFP